MFLCRVGLPSVRFTAVHHSNSEMKRVRRHLSLCGVNSSVLETIEEFPKFLYGGQRGGSSARYLEKSDPE